MFVAIDVGGTNIRIGFFNSLMEIDPVKIEKFGSTNKYQEDLIRIIDTINNFSQDNIEGIGIGVPGVIDRKTGIIQTLPNLSCWDKQNIRNDLSLAFSCNVVIENDASAAALGEALHGAGTGKDFWYITWGTGLGGTLIKVIEHKVYVFPSELGHQILRWDPNDTQNQISGEMESLTGGRDIEKKYGKPPQQLSEDEWKEVERNLAHGIINTLTIHYVPLVIFGGGVAIKQSFRIGKIRSIITENLTLFFPPSIKIAECGDNAGLVGALSLLEEERYEVV